MAPVGANGMPGGGAGGAGLLALLAGGHPGATMSTTGPVSSGGGAESKSFIQHVQSLIADLKVAHDSADDPQDAAELTGMLHQAQQILAKEQKETDQALSGKLSPKLMRKAVSGAPA
jgi:hypothetical protein